MVKYLDKDGLIYYTDILKTKLQELKQLGRYLSNWDATKGLPTTNPGSPSYLYNTGDYYLVSTVTTTEQDKNYRPSGSLYEENIPSTTEETKELAISDIYLYDGTEWLLLKNTQKTVSFANLTGEPNDNINLKNALDKKQETIDDLDTIREGAALGATALQSFTETDPIYEADKPNIALKSEIPTDNAQLANGAGYITAEYHDSTKQDVITDLTTIKSNAEAGKTAKDAIDTYGDIVTHNVEEFQEAGDYATNTALTEGLGTKQDTLVSGTNIKTLNNESLLGEGNIDITSAQWGNITGDIENQTDLQTALDNKTQVIIRSW